MSREILGFNVVDSTAQDCVQEIVSTVRQRKARCTWLACINPHSYAVSRKDPPFRQSLQSATWLVPDGVGILIGGWLLARPFQQRITGSDIFEGVMNELNASSGSVFFLGSTQRTLEAIEKRVKEVYPQVRLVGTYSPPFVSEFSVEEQQSMIRQVNAAAPDVLWVGMTAPKQEKWLSQAVRDLNVPFCAAIGAVFDFFAGTIKRPPRALQRLGLEWLPRLVGEPRRLWRRTMVSMPIFIADVIKDRFRSLYRSRATGA